MIVSKREFQQIDNLSDFLELVNAEFSKVLNQNESVEMIFIELINNRIVIQSKDVLCLDGKNILLFLLENDQPV